jgi:hypothetical protein
MLKVNSPCPECGHSDTVIPVQELYFALIEGDRNRLGKFNLSAKEWKRIRNQIQPPQPTYKPFWMIIHPDGWLLVLISVYFLFVLLNSSSRNWMNVVLPAVFVLLLYALMRKKLVEGYERLKNDLRKSTQRTRKIVENWGNNYLCVKDKIVFNNFGGDRISLYDFQTMLVESHTD